jgi:hypothetical protein
MEYILQQQALAKGIAPALLKGNDFSHVIIKEVLQDERMYLATVVKRILHCCPLFDPHASCSMQVLSLKTALLSRPCMICLCVVPAASSSSSSMLAIDIETMGLMRTPLPPITCACLYDGETEYALSFYGVSASDAEINKSRLLELLDEADFIVGYNAILFDLEYIRRFWGLPEAQLVAWVQKTIDPYVFMKSALHYTCSLNALLAFNQMPSKSASGLRAILWAKEVTT